MSDMNHVNALCHSILDFTIYAFLHVFKLIIYVSCAARNLFKFSWILSASHLFLIYLPFVKVYY